jgi:hypothetical protein
MTPSPAAGPSPQPISSPEPADPLERRKGARLGSFSWLKILLPGLVLIAGLIARMIPASRLFLNPDEALHNLLASQSSIRAAWAAALTNAHPPLLILLLYYWRSLGQSELWLRMPSVVAGTAACWFSYLWLKLVTDRSTAFLGLLLACFAPSLILLSAEIRQYGLLLFFVSACLYFSELALQKDSAGTMVLFTLSLYGALLTHYSALMFAFAIGVYVLTRLFPHRGRVRLVAIWGAGQVGGIAIATYFLVTHIPRLRQTGMVRTDLESYLRKSIYHPGERNPVEFVAAQTLRVFTYTFSHGFIGALLLLAFLAGLIWLLMRTTWNHERPPGSERQTARPSPREFALLLGLPFLVSWGAALAGAYPLGATRHDIFLAPFGIAGASIGISIGIRCRSWIKSVGLVVCLAICNFFPAPSPPIHAKDQSAALMRNAVSYLQASVPSGSVLLTDYESGLLLGYYLCGHGVVQIFPPPQPFAGSHCGDSMVLATSFREWKFTAPTFAGEFEGATKFATANHLLAPGKQIWLFYAGWINDSAPALEKELTAFGCSAPKTFGANIVVCRLAADARNTQ